MKKIIGLMALAIILVGCGSSTKTYETVENNITVDEPYEVPGGTAIIIDSSNDATVTQENQTITIDCGGTCGDITVGLPVDQE